MDTDSFESALAAFNTEDTSTSDAVTNDTSTDNDASISQDGPEDESFADALERQLGGAGDETKEGEETEDGEDQGEETQTASEDAVEQDEEQVKKEMGVKAHERFKIIKDENRTLKTELAATKAELEKAKVKGQVVGGDEITKMQTQLEAANKRLAIFDVESTPEYQDTVSKPLNVITEFVETTADTFGLDADALIDALRQPDEKSQNAALDRILEDSNVPQRVKLKIYQAANDLPHIWQKRDELRTNAAAAMKEIEAKRNADAAAADSENLTKHADALNEVWDKVELNVLKTLPDVDIEKVRTAVAGVKVKEMSPNSLAFALYAAVLLPQLQQKVLSLTTQKTAAEQKLARAKGATPGAGGGKQTPPAATNVTDDMSFAEALEARMRG